MKKIIIYNLLLILGVSVIYSQDRTQRQPLFDTQNKKYETSLERFYQTRSVLRTTVPQVLENELEADNYIVGPGDQFILHIFGNIETEFEFSVVAEGSVVIPTIGEIDVSGLSLKEAKSIILEEVKKTYLKAEISLNLVGLRKFRVYLTGDVRTPGTYFAQGSDRLSDILEVAGKIKNISSPDEADFEIEKHETGLTDWADDTRIEIHHSNGNISIVDISKFYRLGDRSQNPPLKGGDLIFAPSIDLAKSYVIIEGNIGYQGIYPIKQNEKLFEFLRRVAALSKKSNLESIILLREGRKKKIDILNRQEEYANFVLQNRDKIMIPTIYDQVYVRGEVYGPGSFPYRANYTAKDYVGQAGALDSGVDLDKILVINHINGKMVEGGDTIVEKGDTIFVPRRGREVFKDYMTILAPILSLIIAVTALVIK